MKPRAIYPEQLLEHANKNAKVKQILKGQTPIAQFQFLAEYLYREDPIGFTPLSIFADHYVEQKASIYKIAETFGSHLKKLKFDFPIHKLIKNTQEDQAWLIEFPESITFQNETNYYKSAVVVFVGPEDKAIPEMSLTDLNIDGSFFINFPVYDKNAQLTSKSTVSMVALLKGKTLKEILETGVLENHHNQEISKEALEYVLRALLYIESAEPDLKAEPGIQLLNTKGINPTRPMARSPFDIVTVGYSYHGKLQHVEECNVEEHWKWQACGPNWSQHKLLFIEAHHRDYSELKERRQRERELNIALLKEGPSQRL